MFCKYCGVRLTQPQQPCPNCGKEQGPLFETNGFFGVLSATEVSAAKPAETAAAQPAAPVSTPDQSFDLPLNFTPAADPAPAPAAEPAPARALRSEQRPETPAPRQKKQSRGFPGTLILLIVVLLCTIYLALQIASLQHTVNQLRPDADSRTDDASSVAVSEPALSESLPEADSSSLDLKEEEKQPSSEAASTSAEPSIPTEEPVQQPAVNAPEHEAPAAEPEAVSPAQPEASASTEPAGEQQAAGEGAAV